MRTGVLSQGQEKGMETSTSHSWFRCNLVHTNTPSLLIRCPGRPQQSCRRTEFMRVSCRQTTTNKKKKMKKRTCSWWRGRDRPGTSGSLHLYNNPLCSAHNGHRWCWTDSSAGHNNNNPVSNHWFDPQMFNLMWLAKTSRRPRRSAWAAQLWEEDGWVTLLLLYLHTHPALPRALITLAGESAAAAGNTPTPVVTQQLSVEARAALLWRRRESSADVCVVSTHTRQL